MRERKNNPLEKILWENHAVWPRGPCLDSDPQACHSWCIQQILGVHKTPLAAGARGWREGVVAKDATQGLKPSWVTSAVCHRKHTCLIFSPEMMVSTSTFTSPSWKVFAHECVQRHMCVGTCRGITHEHTCKAEHMGAGGTGDRGSGWQLLSSHSFWPIAWEEDVECHNTMHYRNQTSSRLPEEEVASETILPLNFKILPVQFMAIQIALTG